MSQKPVKKAVVLAAGFGTRFLPASKAIPKLLFPVIDRPIIQIVAEEIVKAGITEIIFVLSPFSKNFSNAIKSHFEPFPSLNELLLKTGKDKLAGELEKIEKMANYSFVFQKTGRIGAAIAIDSARQQVGEEPFLLLFADEFYYADPPWISQLVNAYNQLGGNILGCIRTSKPEDGNRFGFITGEKVGQTATKVKELVEKPGFGKAPSDLASMSGMIFQPEIFEAISEADKELPEGKELYHTYAIQKMMGKGQIFYGVEYQNYRFFDTGDRLGYLKSLVELGMEYPDFGSEFKTWLKSLKI